VAGEAEGAGAGEAPAKKTKAPARAAVADFMKDVWASPALSVIVGAKPQPRTEVTKKLWAYIKKHGLQDKKERRTSTATTRCAPCSGSRASRCSR
jgi:upstream activation factor subunit UAF30